MTVPRLLTQQEVRQRLTDAGLTDTGERFSGETGGYSIWATQWGVPVSIPEVGADRTCAELLFNEILEKVLNARPGNYDPNAFDFDEFF